MSAIKLHLEQAERDAVDRCADSLKVTSEDLVYAALNRMMLLADDPAVRRDIVETSRWRRDNLPLWSDCAAGVHAYECKPNE